MHHSQQCHLTGTLYSSYFAQLNVGLIIARLVCATLWLNLTFRKWILCRQKRFNVGPLHDTEFVQRFIARWCDSTIGRCMG